MPTATFSGLSYIFYAADGAATTYPLGFEYLDSAHVVVKVDGTVQTEGADYNLVNGDCVFTTAPVLDADIQIARNTPQVYDDREVDFRSYGSITEDEMDLNQKQIWYLLQEAFETDDAGNVNPSAEYLPWNSAAGVWSAMRTSLKKRIANVEDPATSSDAATKGYVDDIAEWGISGTPQAWSFTTQAGTTNYTLSGGNLLDQNYLIVSIEGILQTPGNDYFVAAGSPNSTLSFNAIPPVGQQVGVQNFGKKRFLNEAVLGENSVSALNLQENSVGNSELQVDAVENENILNATITGAKLVDETLTGSKIADATLDYDKLTTSGFGPVLGGSYNRYLKVNKDSGAQSLSTLSALDLSDWDAELANFRLNDIGIPDGDLNLNNNKIISLAGPTQASDAATKSYVDTAVGGGANARVELLWEVALGSTQAYQEFIVPPGPAWLQDSDYKYYEIVFWNFRYQGGGASKVFLQLYQNGAYTEPTKFTGLGVGSDVEQAWSILITNPRGGSTRPCARAREVGTEFGAYPLGAFTGVRLRGESNIVAGATIHVYGHKAYV